MNYQSGVAGDGERDCAERWGLLEPELAKGSLLDIGSAEGYFSMRAARDLDMMAVSVEADAARVAVQSSVAAGLGGRMAVCRFGFGPDFARRLADTCEFFENALLLSVLHWFDEPEEVLSSVCSVAGRVFVELPEPDDTVACGACTRGRIGTDLQEWLERYSGRKARLLGVVRAHTSETRRLWVLEGAMERTPRRAYLGAPVYLSRFRQLWDGELLRMWIDGNPVDWIPGVNAQTLGRMNVVYPGRDWWRTEALASLARFDEANGRHEDRRIWNLLATADGLKWIDGKCQSPRDGIDADLDILGETT